MSDEFLWQFKSKSSLLFKKYLPDLQKMSSWKIVFSHDGFYEVRTSAWKWHENRNFWRLVACLRNSFGNLTQNQVYFSTNTFPISRKCYLERLSFHMMDITRSELQLENDMKIAISGDLLLVWWIPLAIQLKIKSSFQQIPSRTPENVILKNCLFTWWILWGPNFILKMTWK